MEFILHTLGQIGFNWHVALANFINFLIIFFILKKFVFNKVFAVIDKRNSEIKEGLQNKEDAALLLINSKSQSENIINEAKRSAKEIIISSEEAGQKIKQNIENLAKDKIHNLELDLKSKIDNANNIVLREWENNKKELLSHFLANVFAKNLSKEDNDKLSTALIR